MLHLGYIGTAPGILKLSETVLGVICLFLISCYQADDNGFIGNSDHLFFFLTTFAFLMTTLLMLIAAFVSETTFKLVSKSAFESLYHLFAVIFYISASFALLTNVVRNRKLYGAHEDEIITKLNSVAKKLLEMPGLDPSTKEGKISIKFISHITDFGKNFTGYEGKMAAAAIGLINSVLYLLSLLFSFRSFTAARKEGK